MEDFLIIYNRSDRPWAEWIAWQLGDHDHTALLCQQNAYADRGFLSLARETTTPSTTILAVLSPAFLAASEGRAPWHRTLCRESAGPACRRVGVHVKPVVLHGATDAIGCVDLVDLDEMDARARLHETIRRGPNAATQVPDRMDAHSPDFRNTGHPAYPGALSSIWNICAYRNPNFTGRDVALANIRKTFLAEQPGASIQAIKGMGGIGKTHIAIEYAYRHANDYETIWWVRSGDRHDLNADYAAFADSVGLRKRDIKDQRKLLNSVRAWLEENENWLFVFDNVITPGELRKYLPKTVTGHVLITSRYQQWEGICPSVQVGAWSTDESVAYLVKHTRENDPLNAKRIADALKGLPLALEQAAATMAANEIPYTDYLRLYQTRRNELWKGKSLPLHYPETIGTTLSLAVEKIQTNTPMGVLVLSLCAYAAPENVPFAFIDSASACMPEAWSALFDDASALGEAIELLNRHALISVRLDHLSIHRLVQMAARSRLHHSKQRLWSEIALHSAANMIPEVENQAPSQWMDETFRHSHVRSTVQHAIENDIEPKTVGTVLHRLALSMQACGWPKAAEGYFHQALAICEKQIGSGHPDNSLILGDLAGLHYAQEQYERAEEFYRQALAMIEAQSGADHQTAAICLNNLALSLHGQNQFVDAERSLRQALDLHEAQSSTEEHLRADVMNNLALVLQDQGKYADAETLYRSALTIRQSQFGNEHSDVAVSLTDLAGLLQEWGRYAQAAPLYHQALEIVESVAGPDHPQAADILHSLASLFHDQEHFTHAEPLYRRALEIYETQLETSHPSIAVCLNNLARLLHDQGKYSDAEPLYRRALDIYETQLGNNHPSVAICLNNLARLLHDQGNCSDAEPLYRRTLDILAVQLGDDHPDYVVSLNNLKEMLRDQGRPEDESPMITPSGDNDLRTE